MVIAGSGLYLSGNIGAVEGVAAGSALFQTSLRVYLLDNLEGLPDSNEVWTHSSHVCTGYITN